MLHKTLSDTFQSKKKKYTATSLQLIEMMVLNLDDLKSSA